MPVTFHPDVDQDHFPALCSCFLLLPRFTCWNIANSDTLSSPRLHVLRSTVIRPCVRLQRTTGFYFKVVSRNVSFIKSEHTGYCGEYQNCGGWSGLWFIILLWKDNDFNFLLLLQLQPHPPAQARWVSSFWVGSQNHQRSYYKKLALLPGCQWWHANDDTTK